MAFSDTLLGASKNIFSAGVKGARASYNAGVRGALWAMNGYAEDSSVATSSPSSSGGGEGDLIVLAFSFAVALSKPVYSVVRYTVGVAGSAASLVGGTVASGVVGAIGGVVKGGEMAVKAVSGKGTSSPEARRRSSSGESQTFEHQNPMRVKKAPAQSRTPEEVTSGTSEGIAQAVEAQSQNGIPAQRVVNPAAAQATRETREILNDYLERKKLSVAFKAEGREQAEAVRQAVEASKKPARRSRVADVPGLPKPPYSRGR